MTVCHRTATSAGETRSDLITSTEDIGLYFRFAR